MNDAGILQSPSDIDAAWIGRALQRAGLIEAGGVESIESVPEGERAWSRIVRVRVHYRGVPSAAAPERLLVKLCGGPELSRSEVDYYRRDYADAPDAPMPRCFDAACAEQPLRYHLLLEDLSATHVNGDQVAPDEAFGLALAESLAALHAHRWGSERMRQVGAALPAAADVQAYVGHVAQGLEPMLALVGGELAERWAPRLRRLFGGLAEAFARRAQDARGMTLVHGDVNPGNVLVARDRSGPLLLIDRQPFGWSLTRWLGVSDLVYAMVPWWDTAVRRRVERSVLAHYAQTLRVRGVVDYPMPLLLADYRLCQAMAIAVPVQWCVQEGDRERMRWLWSIQLQRALAAFEDHA